jgi:hypothetical protein
VKLKDRIKEFRRVPAHELQPNPRNWRTHPVAQQDALRGVLAEVGIAGAVLARETAEGGLMLIDGHLRTDVMHDQQIPVLVLDVDEAEADKLLATIDPLAAMAEADAGKLDELLRQIDTGSEALQEMLAKLAEDEGLFKTPSDPANDAAEEWQGMPEFEQEAVKDVCLLVYFPDQETKARFAQVVGSAVNETTKYVWWPAASKPIRQGVDVLVCENES